MTRPVVATGLEPLLSVDDVAGICRVPPKTVHRWLYERTGPPSLRVGKYRRFRRPDVEAWLDRAAEESARQAASTRLT